MVYCVASGARHYSSADSWGLGSSIGSYYGAVEDGSFYGRPPYNTLLSSRDLLVSICFLGIHAIFFSLDKFCNKTSAL